MKGNVEKDDPLWKEYLDKAAVYDERMVDELNKIVDVLLVYVGYFLLLYLLTIESNHVIGCSFHLRRNLFYPPNLYPIQTQSGRYH